MADEQDAASKTEEATPQKLAKAREKGDVAKTPDLAMLASFAGAAAVIAIAGGWMSRNLAAELLPFIAHPDSMNLEGHGAIEVARHAARAAAPILLAVMLVAAVMGAAGNLVQTGLMFSPEKIKPDWKKVSPLGGLKRTLGPYGLMQFFKSLVKIDTVDSYQGKENRIIILSLTRSDRHRSPGFLRTPNRINVAMSRAMDRLLIVGNAEMWRTNNRDRPLGHVLAYMDQMSEDTGYKVIPAKKGR